MIKIMKYLRGKEWLLLLIAAVFIVGSVWLDLSLPEFMQEITKLTQDPSATMRDIWLNGLWMLLCTLGSLACTIVVGLFAAKIGASFSKRIRSELYKKVQNFSMGEINKFSTASLITRTTNDTTQVQLVLTMGLQMAIRAPIVAVWAIIKISGGSTEWTLATVVGAGILVLMFGIIISLAMPRFRKMQVLTDNINRVARENLIGLPVVHAYNAQDYQNDKFKKANDELTGTQLFTSRAMAPAMPVIATILSSLTLSIYWIGAHLINAQADPILRLDMFANMITFSQYTMQIIMAIMMMTMWFVIVPRSQVSAKRINEVLDTPLSIKDGTVLQGLQGVEGKVEFRNVCFKFPGAADHVLHNVSFEANKGETIAFIGSTGSGKSTLINLVPRFFDVTSGEVLIDGVNVKDYKLESLYNKIGYIPQKAVMFDGTVQSNVSFGDNGKSDLTEQDLKKAINIAQGTDFVQKMDGAYEASIARGGANISGGQKQRLSIARAIYKQPEFYIFDDSFSALDYKTDRVLRSTLKKETQGVTSMIVAQRIGTIMDADKIVVLDEGKIVGMGKHKELLVNCPVYKAIAMSQLSEEELAI